MEQIKKVSREYQIPLRLDEKERARLVMIARAWGGTLTSAIRRLIREAKVENVD